MSLVRRNAEILLGTEFATRLLLFVVVVQLMRTLGDDQYGQLAYVFAIANLCVVLADFGLHTYVTRLLAQTNSSWLSERRAIVLLKIVGSLLAWILTLTIVSVTNQLSLIVVTTGALAIITTNGRMFSEAIARGQQRMELEAYSKILYAMIQGVSLLLTLQFTTSLVTIAIVYMVTSIIGWLISLWFVRQPLFQKFSGSHQRIRPLFLAIIPFATSIAINAQFNYFDSAVLGWFYPKAAVAWYAAAYKPIFFVTALVGLIITAFFPRIVKLWSNQNYPAVRATIKRLMTITGLLAIPLAIGGTVLAPWIINLLYTPEYTPAIVPLMILSWSTACIFIWAPLGNSLQACGYEKRYTKNFVIAASLNIPFTIILVWQYSLVGAAIATAITNLCLVGLMAKDAHTYLWKKTA